VKGQRRVLYILELLAKKAYTTQGLSLEIFGEESSSKTRTIQNDLSLLRGFFPESIESNGGVHKLLKIPTSIKSIVNKEAKETKKLLEFLAIFHSNALKLFEIDEPRLIKDLKKEITPLYHIQENPFEEIKTPFLDDIKRAIRQHRYVYIEYEGKKRPLCYKKNQIYKIVYAEHNWYIVVYSYSDNGYRDYRLLRINFIRDFKILSQQFKRDICIENFTKNLQSLFPSYNTAPYEVILKIEPIVMKNFIAKKHLRSQEIIETREDGLLLRFQITNNMELLPLIKKWIPNIKIISSPPHLKEQLKKDIEKYLEEL
jgi:hypothetical protein